MHGNQFNHNLLFDYTDSIFDLLFFFKKPINIKEIIRNGTVNVFPSLAEGKPIVAMNLHETKICKALIQNYS